MKFTNLNITVSFILASCFFSQAGYTQETTKTTFKLTQEATKLRQQGATGLENFLRSHISDLTSEPSSEVKIALDQLCQQRDCYASKLYWYTDLEKAKIAAKNSGKPILSLRLLGRLDTDLSCANSRFFRVALYPNSEISQLLKDKFILHWQTVRPVPKVTIDFGDGRKLERTITGNSIHYILDSSGRPIDAIPGLYGPKAFFNQLKQTTAIATKLNKSSGSEYENLLQQYHLRQLDKIQNQWRADLSKLGIQSPPQLVERRNNLTSPPSAVLAGSLAVSKSVVERPIINSIQPETSDQTPNSLEIIDQATWNKLAQLYQADAKLDANSIALIQAKKLPNTTDKNNLSKVIRNFETVMALDTVRNEYILHRQIHQWFLEKNETSDVNQLNEKVYAELFLTPSSDPWLGLANNDTYNAIDNGGIIENPVSRSR
ncbi:hypothetical protein H6G54_27015 [Anabaena cylindrica FACHB-243]|uniref:Uncharacterized protein n=1 Tax=Anabaena cylindrica (strain ATCC 27899 / PCC 7122) TaxID=272123 RepID=K9ZAT0_ANACC|nr:MULTISPECIES: hypothetical protein [Anabaena]AFZ55844.1 hypothetical protein Anacy_0239 [Anabaena cylindrica PCC 7122]MBD2421266.1 hypothetical protein [Anabaena cylindrica FACHB-243]MBY5285187.1 hypothetical protein [Anabaena sp. CCAP 1446/1C]MBY5306623.1 hypothetical protein [Anabaena sp. CCAP 1446/1C]MCM2406597.1 hypothetical protein [Anabaena sp. CCAP 1446/1C]